MTGKSQGRLILCGGLDADDGYLDQCYKYGNTTNTWDEFATMGEKRNMATLAQINKDTFWIAGM